MAKFYKVDFDVKVCDEEALMRVARTHALSVKLPVEDVADPGSALRMLLDPGAGGQAYVGDLYEAGIAIEDCSSEFVAADDLDRRHDCEIADGPA